jgi:hypothetical protein
VVSPQHLPVGSIPARTHTRVGLVPGKVYAARQAPCLDIRHFVVFMDSLADSRSITGRQSAWAVRAGLQAGGLDIEKYPYYAKEYGPFLVRLGFSQIPNDSPPQPGDIMVLQPELNPSGHLQVWNGSQWVSDFIQPKGREAYRDERYRDVGAASALYRYRNPCR